MLNDVTLQFLTEAFLRYGRGEIKLFDEDNEWLEWAIKCYLNRDCLSNTDLRKMGFLARPNHFLGGMVLTDKAIALIKEKSDEPNGQ